MQKQFAVRLFQPKLSLAEIKQQFSFFGDFPTGVSRKKLFDAIPQICFLPHGRYHTN